MESLKLHDLKGIPIYQVDAFTNRLFSGNPAAVCILDHWLPDDVMQAIGAENNLAETAFVVSRGNDYEIRWFTPAVEVDLCGHATLASAIVIFNILGYKGKEIIFHSTNSGVLKVFRHDGVLFLDFPSDSLVPYMDLEIISRSIGVQPLEVYKGKSDILAVLKSEDEVRSLEPDFTRIALLPGRGLIVTAPGREVDFVSRFFAPQSGIPEDPVTGSAHTSLIPLWYEKSGKVEMRARQLSKRGGELICIYKGKRCWIGGNAVLFFQGSLQ